MTRARAALRRRRWPAVPALAALLAAALAGCAATEPFQRPYVWTASGSTAANLAEMAESPADLAHARAGEPSDGQAAAAAVERLRSDHRRPLDATATSGVTASSGATGGGAGGGAAGASTPPN